jgi:hypothetical protein
MGYSIWDGKRICDACYIKEQGKLEEAMAKKKVENKGKGKDALGRKMAKIQPCAKCGRVDFNTDQARRAHQGKCPGKNPPPVLVKPKSVPIKAKINPETVKMLAGPPPGVEGKKVTIPDLTEDHTAEGLEQLKEAGKKIGEEAAKKAEKRTASQIGRSSKQKGSKFENEVKKELALWYGEDPKVVGSKTSKFQRAPGSGGMSPTNWPLDLFVPTDFPWAVECKNREGDAGFNQMERFFTGDKYPIVEWFKIAEEELVAAKVERPLLLVFKKNGSPIMVALRRPMMASGENAMFGAKHMTMCGAPFGEIVVMELDGLETWQLDTWKSAYALADKASYMPRKW